MMKSRLMATLLAVVLVLAGTSALTEYPVADGDVSFTIFVKQNTAHANYEDIYNFQKYEELTGIHIDWINTPADVTNEKINLTLASGDLPDAFMKCNISSSDLLSYGEAGDFLDLAPLLEEYAPNFWAYANQYPDVLASITMPSGAIYSLPAATDAESTRIALKIFYDQPWLDTLGLSQPTTTDELYEVLKAFKEGDPNGNGEADEVPLYTSLDNLYATFGGMFGVFNRGSNHNAYWDADPDTGAVRYARISDDWRAALEYMNKLYSEGLIDQESVTYSVGTAVGYAAQDRLGTYFGTNLARLTNEMAENFVPIETAIAGPNGDALWTPIRSHLHSVGAFVITTECENPELLLQWVDYFYSDEGCLLYHYGVEGDTCYKNEDGTYSFTDEVLAPMNDGKSYDEALGSTTAYAGGNNPTIMKYPYFCGMEMTEKPMEASANLYPNTPEVVWPIFTYTEDENEIITTTGSDIDTYVKGMTSKFLTGETEITDATWADYVGTVEKMGLAEYAGAVQAAADRAEAVMVAK